MGEWWRGRPGLARRLLRAAAPTWWAHLHSPPGRAHKDHVQRYVFTRVTVRASMGKAMSYHGCAPPMQVIRSSTGGAGEQPIFHVSPGSQTTRPPPLGLAMLAAGPVLAARRSVARTRREACETDAGPGARAIQTPSLPLCEREMHRGREMDAHPRGYIGAGACPLPCAARPAHGAPGLLSRPWEAPQGLLAAFLFSRRTVSGVRTDAATDIGPLMENPQAAQTGGVMVLPTCLVRQLPPPIQTDQGPPPVVRSMPCPSARNHGTWDAN